MPNNKRVSAIKIISFCAILFFSQTNARAEYYIVYPASTSVAPCYSCVMPTEVYRTHYVYTHHYHRHVYRRYHPYQPHRHRSSASISVYYLVPPCGCAGGCGYYYQPCPGCRVMNETPCPNGDCYVPTDDENYDMDTKTGEDTGADMQINDN